MNNTFQIYILKYYLDSFNNIFFCIFLDGINAQSCFKNIAIHSINKIIKIKKKTISYYYCIIY